MEDERACFTNLDKALSVVQDHINVISKEEPEWMKEMSSLDQAKVNVSLAYSINALLYVYLKTQGVSAKDMRQTQVKQELSRVRSYIQKIKDAEEAAKERVLVVDKEASSRMIESALSSDQVYQEAKRETEKKNKKRKVKTPVSSKKKKKLKR